MKNLSALKSQYDQDKQALFTALKSGKINGISAEKKLAKLADDFLVQVFENKCLSSSLAVLAVGGFGREELAPFSDLDLWFIGDKKSAETLSPILYALWDMGINISYATADLAEALELANRDFTVRTTFLDARFLWGNQDLFTTFKTSFTTLCNRDDTNAFFAAKIAELTQRHQLMSGARYVLEPHLKNAIGAMRDLNFIEWLAKYRYPDKGLKALVTHHIFTPADLKTFMQAKNFFFTLRCFLHFYTKRQEDILSAPLQAEIAPLMGYKPHKSTAADERLMKRFYLFARDTGYLLACLLSTFDKAPAPHFTTLENMLAALPKIKNISPSLTKEVWRMSSLPLPQFKTPTARLLLKDIITKSTNPAALLRLLNESGILVRLVPEFMGIYAKPQKDIYHIYTVDEHTLEAVKALTFLLSSPDTFWQSVREEIPSFDALKVATFLHDIGKEKTLGHASKGAELSRKITPLFGMSAQDAGDIYWLISQHLAMTKTAYNRDLNDPKTIRDFAALTGSKSRLAMLLLLTVSDIMAVAPNVWTDWKFALLRQLYENTLAFLSGTKPQESSAGKAQTQLKTMQTLAATKGTPFAFAVEERPEMSATKVTVFAPDRMGLFADIVGAITASKASIMTAKIHTIEGFALDTFFLEDLPPAHKPFAKPSAFTEPSKLAKLERFLTAALAGTFTHEIYIKDSPAPHKSQKVASANNPLYARVLIDNEASENYTVIDINAADSKGFLWRITHTFSALSLNIISAHIATYGDKVVDSFYVTDTHGKKIVCKDTLAKLQKTVYDVIST